MSRNIWYLTTGGVRVMSERWPLCWKDNRMSIFGHCVLTCLPLDKEQRISLTARFNFRVHKTQLLLLFLTPHSSSSSSSSSSLPTAPPPHSPLLLLLTPHCSSSSSSPSPPTAPLALTRIMSSTDENRGLSGQKCQHVLALLHFSFYQSEAVMKTILFFFLFCPFNRLHILIHPLTCQHLEYTPVCVIKQLDFI